jgi:DNA-directed RNA polymerase specialized sigma24 family protein
MTTSELRKRALTETYYDLEQVIYKIIWNHIKKYGGDFEELKAEANLIYILAYDSYQETIGNITTWICFCLRTGLINHCKNKSKQLPIHSELYNNIIDKKSFSPSYLLETFDEIHTDSKTIFEIILYPPKGLSNEDLEKGFKAHKTRIYLRNYLKKLGWTGKRIKESFTEIKRILNDN